MAYLSMGPEQAAEALRRALAMGGEEAYLVTDASLAGADEWATAKVLAAALDKLAPDVALMGMASDDARGSLVPGAVAAIRKLPLLSYGSELSLADGSARIRRLSAAGYDILEAPLPVVATVTDQVGEPRYASLKGIMAAKRKPLETWSLGDIGLSADALGGRPALTRVVEARPPEAKPPTERIENLGADEAAVNVADWLAARKLV
ncbi:MAG TPA: electron transfer flavoprotein subunit beta/FixA family protein [Candidatus Limnocylindria bacterium]|nr:electron transfer flavoprotein subunit beta/FixA family protein [Candidatus Limnocylindria bacterium]